MITKDFNNHNIEIQEMKNKILQGFPATQSNLSASFFLGDVPSNSGMTPWYRGTNKANSNVPFTSPQTSKTKMNGGLVLKSLRPHQHHNLQPQWQFSLYIFCVSAMPTFITTMADMATMAAAIMVKGRSYSQ